MGCNLPVSHSVEEDRIRTAYANRQRENRYSKFNLGHLFILQVLESQLLNLLRRKYIAPLDEKKILEIGCGTGYWLREFINWGAQPQNLFGVDLLAERVAKAKRLCPDAVQIECGSATKLGFADGSFDLVLQSTVFSSVLNLSTKQQIASEMLRVVKVNGAVLWYDFHMNNPRNPDVQGLKKPEIFQLFPNCRIELKRITLAPPLARFLAPYSLLTCYLLERVKVFNSHYLGIIRKL